VRVITEIGSDRFIGTRDESAGQSEADLTHNSPKHRRRLASSPYIWSEIKLKRNRKDFSIQIGLRNINLYEMPK